MRSTLSTVSPSSLVFNYFLNSADVLSAADCQDLCSQGC